MIDAANDNINDLIKYLLENNLTPKNLSNMFRLIIDPVWRAIIMAGRVFYYKI